VILIRINWQLVRDRQALWRDGEARSTEETGQWREGALVKDERNKQLSMLLDDEKPGLFWAWFHSRNRCSASVARSATRPGETDETVGNDYIVLTQRPSKSWDRGGDSFVASAVVSIATGWS